MEIALRLLLSSQAARLEPGWWEFRQWTERRLASGREYGISGWDNNGDPVGFPRPIDSTGLGWQIGLFNQLRLGGRRNSGPLCWFMPPCRAVGPAAKANTPFLC